MMILGCKRVSFQLVKLNRRVKMVVLKNSRRLYLKKWNSVSKNSHKVMFKLVQISVCSLFSPSLQYKSKLTP